MATIRMVSDSRIMALSRCACMNTQVLEPEGMLLHRHMVSTRLREPACNGRTLGHCTLCRPEWLVHAQDVRQCPACVWSVRCGECLKVLVPRKVCVCA